MRSVDSPVRRALSSCVLTVRVLLLTGFRFAAVGEEIALLGEVFDADAPVARAARRASTLVLIVVLSSLLCVYSQSTPPMAGCCALAQVKAPHK